MTSFQQLQKQFKVWTSEDSLPKPYADTFFTHTSRLYQKIQNKSILFLNTQNSYQFIAGFLVGIEKECKIFLGNPQWKQQEEKQVLEQVKPNFILNDKGLETITSVTITKEAAIMIPTGGSSGNIRFVRHSWETLSASVKGFCQYFNQETVNCFCLLPLYHVSGLMQLMRSFLSGGHLFLDSYKTIETAWRDQDLETIQKLETFPQKEYFLSLVPTQLQRLLNYGAGNWLSQFKTVLLGGAPPWKSLLDTARAYNIPIALTYGMTETASQVVTLKPNDFLVGNYSVGQVLPHAKIWIIGETGEKLPTGEVGKITIQSQSLGLGYYGHSNWNREAFVTDDLGYFDGEGYLYIVGRNSRKIITGGENVFPDEVEVAILSTGLVRDVYVLGIEDENWGEVVTAFYVPKEEETTTREMIRQLKLNLSNYKIPKHWRCVREIPRNKQGKVILQQLPSYRSF